MIATVPLEARINDPLRYLATLPHVARFYPYGFPVDIASDTPEVLDAAQESWGAYAARFERPPLRLHVLTSEGSGAVPPAPVLRGQRNLLMWVSDQENFAVCDRLQRFGYSCVTRVTLADRVFFRWHFLDALIYMLLELNYFTSIHAACVAWHDSGVLLLGPSGVGKTTLSYACARRGWTYISDDGSSVVWDGGRTVIGEPHHFRFRADAPVFFPELRGRTLGRELERKPTIEVCTADLSIRTAHEASVERIVFLERGGGRASLKCIGKEEALDLLWQEQPAFDPELEARRRAVIESLSEAPAFRLRYSHYEEAALRLEELVCCAG